MKTVRVCLMVAAVALCALVLSPGMTRADTLTGSTGIAWVFGTSTFATDTIADGSSLVLPRHLADLRGAIAAMDPRRSVWVLLRFHTQPPIYPPGLLRHLVVQRIRFYRG